MLMFIIIIIIIVVVCCYYLSLLHCHSLRKALSSKLHWQQRLIFLNCHLWILCDTWWDKTIWAMDSQGELSHRICCGPSQIYFYWTFEIVLGNRLSQLLLSMSNCFLVNITILLMFILTFLLVKMTIIIWVSVRRMCFLFFFPF